MASDYHHGDLPATLRATAVELIAEKGPAGFSLREVARRAGVSHAAPAHHFGDTQGLLTSVAVEGFNVLTERMRLATAPAQGARERFVACGSAYVHTALENPGHYKVMVTHEYTDEYDPDLLEAGMEAYAELIGTVEVLRDEYNPDLDVASTATVVWSFVHGLAELSPVLDHVAKQADTETAAIHELLESFTDVIIDGARVR